MVLLVVVRGRLLSIGVAVCSARPALRTPARNHWLAISTWIESGALPPNTTHAGRAAAPPSVAGHQVEGGESPVSSVSLAGKGPPCPASVAGLTPAPQTFPGR